MRMLMGANDIYADGKAQPIPTNGLNKIFTINHLYINIFYFDIIRNTIN